MNENEIKKIKALRWGVIVLIILAILTAVEYFIGAFTAGWWALLLVIAAAKAFFVLRDYMHLPRLFASEEELH